MKLIDWLFSRLDGIRHRLRLGRWNEESAWGRRAEDLTHRYLQSRGMVVVDRNWHIPTRRGELDLVAWDGAKVVFVEVKSRRSSCNSDPERAIDDWKLDSMRRAAVLYLRRWRIPPEQARLDLVTIVFEPFELRHIPDAWSLRG